MIPQAWPRRKVDEREIRRQFNERRLWEQAQSGVLAQRPRKDRHPNPPPATEALCTRSQIVLYVDCHGRAVALWQLLTCPDRFLGQRRPSSGSQRLIPSADYGLPHSHRRMAWRRAHNFAEREPITYASTVGRDLGKRRFAQRFPVVPW
jgi:hypothetical protein